MSLCYASNLLLFACMLLDIILCMNHAILGKNDQMLIVLNLCDLFLKIRIFLLLLELPFGYLLINNIASFHFVIVALVPRYANAAAGFPLPLLAPGLCHRRFLNRLDQRGYGNGTLHRTDSAPSRGGY